MGAGKKLNKNVGARLHQGSALSPILFAVVIESLKDEVMQEFLLTFIFADNIVICSETKEWVEVCSGEKRMKVSRITEYVCVNKKQTTVILTGAKIVKLDTQKSKATVHKRDGIVKDTKIF